MYVATKDKLEENKLLVPCCSTIEKERLGALEPWREFHKLEISGSKMGERPRCSDHRLQPES